MRDFSEWGDPHPTNWDMLETAATDLSFTTEPSEKLDKTYEHSIANDAPDPEMVQGRISGIIGED
jgi:hypothetical protein